MVSLKMQMLTCAACRGLTPHDSPSRTCLHCDAPLRRPPRWVLRLSALLGPTGALLLAACYGAPGMYRRDHNGPEGATRVDRDGDGAFGPWECGNYSGPRCHDELAHLPPPPDLDCDDNDRTRYPGAQDIEGDGIDQNCDGVDGWRDPSVAAPPEGSGRTYATPPEGSGAKIAVPPGGTP